MLYNNIVEAIGNTPLIKLNGLDEEMANVYVKLESRNPSGSVKDRPVRAILENMLETDAIQEGGVIVEPTSGNTGIALAAAGAALGLKVVLVMPESMSIERRKLMTAYGAEIVLTGEGGMATAAKKAQEIADERQGLIFGQFTNQLNPQSHEETTAKEILADLNQVDGFVAGFGTGGTVTGVSKVLKANNSDTLVWALEPKDSPLISQGKAGGHKIQGIGANFVPEVLNLEHIDEVKVVANEDAINTAVATAKEQGILAGISSGANIFMALQMAKELGKGKNVVTIVADTGERYLSSGIFGNEGE
ncbi:cysteine synthase A [Ignavigranum ruoffiae]|uniref:cysteine synthase n=1 Tax=Ignavigranum ruoffiae TaxID=89093 RepID=A0A1H9AL39_9LACT|nr:cysteine synthase A [Ignavigranum ruoffiae]SEP77474.1 cysteine synthase A [Ignavigranum ruoffiae]